MIGQLVARRKDVRSMLKQEKDAGRRAQLDIRQKALKIIAPNPNPNPNLTLTLTLTLTRTTPSGTAGWPWSERHAYTLRLHGLRQAQAGQHVRANYCGRHDAPTTPLHAGTFHGASAG